jgi:hypothetical protein
MILVLLSLSACATKPRTPEATVALSSATPAPTGNFVAPGKLELRLNPDGTYAAEDTSQPEFWFMVEGNMVYPQRVKSPPQKGRWTWHSETGHLRLTAETPHSFRWGIQNLRFDQNNPDRLAWGGAFLERAETVNRRQARDQIPLFDSDIDDPVAAVTP